MFIIHEFDGHVTSSVKGLGVCVCLEGCWGDIKYNKI